MTAPSHESEPIQEALFELPTLEEPRESVREDLGYDKAFKGQSLHEQMHLASIGQGTERARKRHADHAAIELRRGGTPRPELTHQQSELAKQAFTRASQGNIDRMYRAAIVAEEGIHPDKTEKLRKFNEIDKSNRRLVEQGRPIIEPSLEALPEFEWEAREDSPDVPEDD